MKVHSSVDRKHSSQNIRGGKRMRWHLWHVRAMKRPFWSSSRNLDIASPADQAYFASGRNRVCVTLPSRRSAARSSIPGHREIRAVMLTSRSEEHTSELQSLAYLVCRLLLEKKKITQ